MITLINLAGSLLEQEAHQLVGWVAQSGSHQEFKPLNSNAVRSLSHEASDQRFNFLILGEEELRCFFLLRWSVPLVFAQ